MTLSDCEERDEGQQGVSRFVIRKTILRYKHINFYKHDSPIVLFKHIFQIPGVCFFSLDSLPSKKPGCCRCYFLLSDTRLL